MRCFSDSLHLIKLASQKLTVQNVSTIMKSRIGFCGFSLLALGLGCSVAAAKDQPAHQRGWIGGQFERVTVFPIAFSNAPKAALLITALNTNTPASLAGLTEGDLILEVNHQPATKVHS